MKKQLKNTLLTIALILIGLSVIAYVALPDLREARFNIAFFCFVFPLVLLVAALLLVKDELNPVIWRPFAKVALGYEILKFVLLLVALKLPLWLLILLEAILVVILLTTLYRTIQKHKLAK